MDAITLNLDAISLTEEQFFQLCSHNRDLRFERNANGDLIIMPPTGGETGHRNAGLTAQVWLWNEQNQTGMVFDSSTGFRLPNGANRSPDVAWLTLERWNSLTVAQQQRFLPLCPDFLIELRSPTDTLTAVRQKMTEYRDNGMRLGWLIDPIEKRAEIYRPNAEVETLNRPSSLSGEAILPGFVLNLERIL
ncbi:MAG: Uma2 family endonuclease [Spirulinaceae cyanobacterium]